MTSGRKVIAIGLVTCLLAVPFSDLGASPQGKAPPNPTLVKQQVHQLGVGAYVKVKLTDAKKLRGTIEAVDDEGFLLISGRHPSPRRIAYNQVARLRLVKLSYRASGQPDPAEARRVVTALGIGNHITVKIAGGKKHHGQIQAIEPDHFTLELVEKVDSPTLQIAYRDVWRVKHEIKAARITRTVAIVAAVVIFFAAAIWLECSACLPNN